MVSSVFVFPEKIMLLPAEWGAGVDIVLEGHEISHSVDRQS